MIGGCLESSRTGESSTEGDRSGNDGVKRRDAARAIHESHHSLQVGGPEGTLGLHLPRLIVRELGDGELVVACLSRGGCCDEPTVA